MLREAALYPGGYVYEIDAGYDREGAVPPHAVIRGWKVGMDGKPTGEYHDNPQHGHRQPLVDVQQIVAEASVLARSKPVEFDVLVASDLKVGDQRVPSDVGIAIIIDKIVGLGYQPHPDSWRTAIDGGWRYRWKQDS
jgi:hypothetical protein